LGTADDANIEVPESVGENNVCECLFISRCLQELVTDLMSHLYRVVFFGHLVPDVEDLRYQHVYHPVPIERKCPALAHVLNKVSERQSRQAEREQSKCQCDTAEPIRS
jgi:glycogen phosphorylase